MKDAVAGELAAAYHSAIVDRVRSNDYQYAAGRAHDSPRARVRVLLRRGPRGRLRLSGAPPLPWTERLPDRRDHPQPARQRSAARRRHPLPQRSGRALGHARTGRRRDPARLRRHGGRHVAAREPGLHARRHDVRVGAERLEERRPLRAGRLHRDHPRQGASRGDAGDRVAGPEVSARPLPGRPRSRGSRHRVRVHPPGRRFSGVSGAVRSTSPRPASIPTVDLVACRLRQPDDDADDRIAGDRGDVPGGDDGPIRRAPTSRRTSAPSTRSAARRRSARTPSSRCSTSTRWI